MSPIEQIRIQKIPHVHPDYVHINHAINNLNEVIWEIAKGRNSWQDREDSYGFFLTSDISDNVVSVVQISGNVLRTLYQLRFFDDSKSQFQVRTNRHRGYFELKLSNVEYVFTETKDGRDLNTDQEVECARFITQLCNMIRVVNCAPPYPHKWKKKNNE